MADIYDRRYDSPRGKAYHGHISRRVMECLPQGVSLLDIGCGTGLFIQRYTTDGGTAVGLDISSGMVEMARRRCPGSDFVVGTAEVLPFCDAQFDAVASLLAFSYLSRPDRMLRETYRVLRPGGCAAICTLGSSLLTLALVPTVYRLGEFLGVRRVGVGDFDEHYYTDGEILELFDLAGFEEVTVRRCSFANIHLADPIFAAFKAAEPFVEEKLPGLAYNILASGRKPVE